MSGGHAASAEPAAAGEQTVPADMPQAQAGVAGDANPTSAAGGPRSAILAAIAPKIEAALLCSERPLSAGRLAEALDLDATAPVQAAIAQLNADYARTGRSFRIEAVAGGFRVLTLPEHADVMLAMSRVQPRSGGGLSPAQLETLSIVAYRQPVLRTDVEAVRGVACGEVLRVLMERHLVKIVGRAEELGRPMLYGTTKQFLEVFGLASLRDLPQTQVQIQGQNQRLNPAPSPDPDSDQAPAQADHPPPAAMETQP